MRGVSQGGTGIHVAEGVGGELEAEGRVFAGILIGGRVGHSGGIVGIGHDDVEGIGNVCAVAVVGDDIDAQRADMGVEWRAAESAGQCIEAEPGGQGAAAGQLRGIGQGTGIHVVEGVGGELEVIGRILGGILVGNGVGHSWEIVDRCDIHRDIGIATGAAIAVADGDSYGTRCAIGVVVIAVGVGQVAYQRLNGSRRGVAVEGDDQVAARITSAERAYLRAAIADDRAGYADLAGACALVADGQYVLRTHSVAGDGDGDITRVEVGRVAVGHRGQGACVQ